MIKRDDIVDYFREYEDIPKAMQRDLKVPLDSDFIISIIGPRRAGKTYFLFSLCEKLTDATYLNFEDSRLIETEAKEIRELIRIFIEIYGKTPKYLLLDEIQNVEDWEKIVRELYDLRKYRIFITGSSSKLLSKEIATQLRGRSLSFILLPLSFREFLRFKKIKVNKFLGKDERAKIKNLLRNYIEFGGFPDIVKNEEKVKILKEYSDLILFRDFIERHRVKNLDLARALHTFMIQNFSKEVSIRALFNKLKTSLPVAKDTVYEYVTKLEDTMFFFFLRKFSERVHLRELWPKKIYICDTGLTKTIRYSQDYGKLIENVVFLELLKKTNIKPLLEIYYWKDYQQREVDFVIREGMKVGQLIQVTYASARDEIERREIKALIKASNELRCKNLLIITWDYEEEEVIDSREIKFIPLWKWLLG
ncbi:MAG: AAA family ATPase [Candidatus Altiarchaeales archaeon]|nr:MAG: AAA family ATPase [Candidatus Altiarchaeales archaeon]HDO82623.1 ATP-binding protein [Candidatus Altiarchaeales archaeon]HEX55272.1 ATP-binding protein [Candidatus Altiarchaeales archaeon]